MLNEVSLVGRLTRDLEVRYTDSQMAVSRFTLAVERTFKREGGATVDFIPILVFGKTAETCYRFLKKGRLIAISGRIQTRNWDDKAGVRHYATEVLAGEVDFLDKGSDNKEPEGSNNANEYGVGFHPAEAEDDLPF